MTGPLTSVIQHGQRKRTVPKGTAAEVNCKPNPRADPCKGTRLPKLERRRMQGSVSSTDQISSSSSTTKNSKPTSPVHLHKAKAVSMSEWRQIQDRANGMDKEKERLTAAARQREAMHLCSKEAAKNWPDTIAARMQKMLEARKIREEVKEEERMKIDIEEAQYQEQKRKEAIERAKTMQLFQVDRVKTFHSAVINTEVLKEREAQIELKKIKEKEAKYVDNQILATIMHNEEQALQKEQAKSLERKKNRLAFAESLKQQIKVHEQAREEERMEQEKEAEEFRRSHQLYIKEQITHKQKKQKEKRDIMLKAYLDTVTNKQMFQTAEAEKQELEEARRRRFVKAKYNMIELWKGNEVEKFREGERHREALAEKLAAHHRDKAAKEEERIAKTAQVAAEAEAKQDERQREQNEKKAGLLKSIAEHREALRKEQEYKKQMEKRKAIEMQSAKKASDIAFYQKQLMKDQKKKEAAKMQKATHIYQMAEKLAQGQRMKNLDKDFEDRKAEIIAQEENVFENYKEHVIQKASEAQRNPSILYSAATKDGRGGGLGLAFKGVKPSCLGQEQPRVQLPSYAYSSLQAIKELQDPTDIQDAKDCLGLIWEF